MELKFIDDVSRTFFSLGILNDEACCARIHIKENHEGVEPKENFSPEFFASAEDFVCLICVKKYDGRHNLKSHLVKKLPAAQ